MDATPPSYWQSAPRKRASIGVRARLGYFLAAAAFVGSAWMATQGAQTVRMKEGEAGEIAEFLGSLRKTFSLLQDMETGQRGYVITNRPDYLEPYHSAALDLGKALQELRQRNAKRTDQRTWLADFNQLIRQQQAELSRTIKLVDDGHSEQAVAIIVDGEGRRAMDAIRRAVADRQRQDLALMQAARDDALSALERAFVMGVGAAMLGVGIVAISCYRIRNELTARQALRDELFRQREELRFTLFSIGDGVIATDAQGRVQTLNGMAEQLTGWSNQQAAGQPLAKVFEIINEPTRESVENPAPRALREGQTVGLANHTILVSHDGSERAIDGSAAPIRDADEVLLGAVLVFRDVTEQRATQADLLECQRRKDDFLAMLGHELRNPLAGILNGVQVLRILRPEGDAARMQEVIERQAAQMSQMVDDLLDVSRFVRGTLTLRREHLDLREVLRVTVEDFRKTQLAEHCQLTADLPDAEVWVWGDRNRLAQAVSILIHNGCKFCDGPNHVTVALRIDDSTKSAVIAVSDQGLGMDEATLANIFQPWMQADTSIERSRGGLGLGLAIVQGLVKLHDGQVTASSDGLGCGSQFSICLPLSATPAVANNPPVEAAARVHRVLIIDDRRDAVMPLEKMLQMDGHQVRAATNGENGLEVARAFRPSIVLCDIGLADGMNGYEVARELRRQPELADVYLVAVTGYGHEDDRQNAQAAGFDYHLTKPVDKRKLDYLVGHMPRF